jgi:hypothetical protein
MRLDENWAFSVWGSRGRGFESRHPDHFSWTDPRPVSRGAKSSSRRSVVSQLMNPLVGDAQHPSRIAGAHLQLALLQKPDGATRRGGGSSVFFSRSLPEPGIRLDGLGGGRQFHVIDDVRRLYAIDKQLQSLEHATPGFVNRPALRVASADLANRRHPPARFVSFVRNVVRAHDVFNHPFPKHGRCRANAASQGEAGRP